MPSYTFSQRRLSWVFEGTWKVSTKRFDQLHIFFAVQTIFKFLIGLRKISTKRCDQSHIFFAVQTILSFWWDLESFDKKLWPVAHFWQYRLSQVFDGAWKKFHKEVCPVTRCVRCGDYLKFWMGLRKVSTKMCAQLHVFAVQTIWSFWMALRKISTKMCAQLHVFSLWRLTWVLMGLGKFRQKGVTSYTFFSQYRLSQVFEGTWKVSTKRCDQLHIFFAVQTILKFLDGT